MTDAGIAPRLLETFLEELGERTTTLEADLLSLERSADPAERSELAASVFRCLHSLKGAAHAIGALRLESFCHDLESRLGDARLHPALLRGPLVSALISATDVLMNAGDQLRAGVSPEMVDIRTVRARTEALPTGPAPVAPETPALDPTVQLRTEMLDGLVAVSGEAVVARERITVATSALDDLEAFLAAWRKTWPAERATLMATGSGAAASGRIDDRLAALDTLVADRVARVVTAVRDHDGVASALDARLRKLRLEPFAAACNGLERIVRDVALAQGKEVRLVIVGHELEIDRGVLARLRDPLRHLARNAVDHGIESTAERERLGKPPATITITAAAFGDRVKVTLEDDGRGIDEDAVRAHAAKRGLAVPGDHAAVARLLFAQGFSTKAVATTVSGRGVGLDAVRTTVEGMLGRVRVDWVAGAGTTFVLEVPLSLATEHAVLVRAGGCTFALPSRDVRRASQVLADEIRTLEGRPMFVRPGTRPIPLQDLAAALGLPIRDAAGDAIAIIAVADDHEVAFVVDEILEARQLVVTTLGRRLRDVPLVVGAAILGNGEIALLIDVARLIGAPAVAMAAARPRAAQLTKAALPLVLAVDDSATTRSLMRSILETAGYEVVVAVDGAEAWASLQLRTPALIVSDVDMPRMNGLDLCAMVRGSPPLRGVPFVLVTSLGSDKDRLRGMEVGADAYIVKGEFDQGTLLDTVQRLLA